MQLIYGALYGHPALDLQMIRASVELSTTDVMSLVAHELDCDSEGSYERMVPSLAASRGRIHIVSRRFDMTSWTGVWSSLAEVRAAVSAVSSSASSQSAPLDWTLFVAVLLTFSLSITLFGAAVCWVCLDLIPLGASVFHSLWPNPDTWTASSTSSSAAVVSAFLVRPYQSSATYFEGSPVSV